MLLTFLAFAAVGNSMAMRPEKVYSSVSTRIKRVGDFLAQVSSPSNSLAALEAATGVLDSVLAETGNATDHISGDDVELLGSVISLVEKTIYSSMDQSHAADVSALADAALKTAQCNSNIAHRQSPDGDLGVLLQQVTDKQTELNRLQGIVDDETDVNETKWSEFDSHMQMISEPPVCPGLPNKNMAALNVFFENSAYVDWFTNNQASYDGVRDAWRVADSDLEDAIGKYNLQRAVRDQQYCDYKNELVAACDAFDKCFETASDFFTNILVPNVTSDMNGRIEVKKAGDTLIHQIRFLLAEVNEQATPPIDTSRFEIGFPDLSPKGNCDKTPLDSDKWVPNPVCHHHLVGPIMLSVSSKGSGEVTGDMWKGSSGWTGVRGDERAKMCTPEDTTGTYNYRVIISEGTYHQVGVAAESCCAGKSTASSNLHDSFAALYSHNSGWGRHRGAGRPVGSPTMDTWWASTWDSPRTLLVTVECQSKSFRVGIQGGDLFLGEMSWPASWAAVYPFTGYQLAGSSLNQMSRLEWGH